MTVHRATAAVHGRAARAIPAGSYVVKSAQAFRPHVLDMFEPQDHPDDIPYPGGPPTRPYDNAGWTLAYQMGVKVDRMLDGFDGPFEKLSGLQKPAPGKVTTTATAGYTFSHAVNDSFTAINRLLAAGEDVSLDVVGAAAGAVLRRHEGVDRGGRRQDRRRSRAQLRGRVGAARRRRDQAAQAADRPGRSVRRVDALGLDALAARAVRVPVRGRLSRRRSTRATWRAASTSSSFRPASARPGRRRARRPAAAAAAGAAAAAAVPRRRISRPQYQSQLGAYTAAQTGSALKKFLEDGGTILAVGRSAMNLAEILRAAGRQSPRRAVAGRHRRGRCRQRSSTSRARCSASRSTTTSPIAHGMTNPLDVFFDNSPVFRLEPEAALKGVRPVAWFDSANPLRSGWAYGQGYLQGGVAVVDASVGKGKLFLFGPEITFRAQPHGTFKFLFNGIYLAARAPGTGAATDSAR